MKKYERGLGLKRFSYTVASLFLVVQLVNAVEPDGGLVRGNANVVTSQTLATDRIIVKFNDTELTQASASDLQFSLQQLSLSAGIKLSHMRKLATGADLIRLAEKKSGPELRAVLKGLRSNPAIQYAEPDRLMQPMLVPNDPRYNEQWHYFESAGGLNLPAAWDITDGSGAVVAVIDTGYRPHADLAANVLPGYDMIADTFVANDGDGRDANASDPGDYSEAGDCSYYDPGGTSSWHGTHVAGTIAATTNNAEGVAGVAYGAKIVPVRALGRCGGYTSDIADSIIWAAGGSVSGAGTNANPADVINLSLGGAYACDTTTQSAINTARELGATVVVASGNSAADASGFNPASCNGVITVSATARNGGRASYSNYGSVVDIAAPGGDFDYGVEGGVLSLLNSGATTPLSDTYAYHQGTSMAAPHVAGVAALVYSVNPSFTPDEVEAILKASARSFPASCSQCGAGIVEAEAAVLAAMNGGSGGGGDDGGGVSEVISETDLSGNWRSWAHFTIDVPTGVRQLRALISSGYGDADLFVRFADEPTLSSYECRPYLWGNKESCIIDFPAAGTWYVSVYASRWSYRGVSLTAEVH